MANPILVTGAAGRVGAVGRTVTELLLKQGKAVRAMVRNEDERAQALRDMGAEVVVGDLLDLDSMHRVIAGCETMYFGMSVSDAYLAATVNAAAVAKHHGVKAFINMSQMTLSQMSITETTASPQHKLHWLAEQALNWSGLPVVHVRPTVFLEGFFLIFTSDSVRKSNQIRLPFGEGKTSPVAAEDVARVVAALLANPQPHIGKIYHLTGPQSENMHFYAQEYSKALGRTITFQDIPVEPWQRVGSLTGRSLDQHDERLPFFDDIRGELRAVAAADVLRRVDRSGRDEQDVAGLERHRRLALDLILQRAFEDIDDLFARMRVPGERHSRREVDAHLDDLASGDAEIVPLEIGALDSRLLRPRHVQRQTASDDQHRYRHDSSRFHVDLLSSF